MTFPPRRSCSRAAPAAQFKTDGTGLWNVTLSFAYAPAAGTSSGGPEPASSSRSTWPATAAFGTPTRRPVSTTCCHDPTPPGRPEHALEAESDQWNELIARASRSACRGRLFDSLGHFVRRLFKGPPVVPSRPASPSPAYGVFVATAANNQNDYWVYNGYQAAVHGGGRSCWSTAGRRLLGLDRLGRRSPRSAGLGPLRPPSTPQPGECVGPEGRSLDLGRGLPGFVVLSVDAQRRALVERTHGDNTRTANSARHWGPAAARPRSGIRGRQPSERASPRRYARRRRQSPPNDDYRPVLAARAGWKVVNAACPAGS